jgi:hypothetical protein
MNWKNLFVSKQQKHYSFGRGLNAEIAPDEEELFNKSSSAFEEKRYFDGYELFLNSLQNYTDGQKNNNISIIRNDEEIRFELLQGSVRIDAKITQEDFYAEVIMIKSNDASVALKRYLLERNYQLTYANYFSDTKHIKLKLFFKNETMNPQKIFFPIREMALNGDFDKEYIKSEFPNTPLADIDHIQTLQEEELEFKYTQMQEWIAKLEEKQRTLPSNDNSNMQAFLYLNLLFKMDYLLTPRYDIYHKTSVKIREYFSEEVSTIEAKNEEIKIYIETLKEMPFSTFKENFHQAKYSFSTLEKTSFEDVVTFINESLLKIRWYKNNRYPQIIPTIYQYIAFYTLYNYGLNSVVEKLLYLLVEIQNPSFFQKLDANDYYDEKKETLNKRLITSQIETIIKEGNTKYKFLENFSDELEFSSLNEFCNAYYKELVKLNFEEL